MSVKEKSRPRSRTKSQFGFFIIPPKEEKKKADTNGKKNPRKRWSDHTQKTFYYRWDDSKHD